VLDIEINERKTKLASRARRRLRPCRGGGTKRRETVRNGMELALKPFASQERGAELSRVRGSHALRAHERTPASPGRGYKVRAARSRSRWQESAEGRTYFAKKLAESLMRARVCSANVAIS